MKTAEAEESDRAVYSPSAASVASAPASTVRSPFRKLMDASSGMLSIGVYCALLLCCCFCAAVCFFVFSRCMRCYDIIVVVFAVVFPSVSCFLSLLSLSLCSFILSLLLIV